MNGYKWELYDLTKDWTQSNDLAAKQPDKLKELQELFIVEATKYQVFPLDNSMAARMISPRPSLTAGRDTFTYSGELTGIPIGGRSVTAQRLVHDHGRHRDSRRRRRRGHRHARRSVRRLGLLPLERQAGFSLEPARSAPPSLGRERGTRTGKHTLEFTFKYEGLGAETLAFNNRSGLGHGGPGTLKVDGQVVSSHKMEHSLPVIVQWDESFDIGADTGTPVDDKDYQVPFKFTGKLANLKLKIDRPKLSPADEKRLAEESRRNNRTSE